VAKKSKDKNKCIKCGYRIAFATVYGWETTFDFDQEPYDNGVIEPVMVGGQDMQEISVEMSLYVHICPNCGWIRDMGLDK